MPRQHPTQHPGRPHFQRLRQQRMVGISENFGRNFPGGVPRLSVNVDQLVHHFGDGQCRMGVVELNANVFRHPVEVVAFFHKATDNVLNGTGNKEILLFKTQFLARFDRIRGIQNFGNGFVFDFVF